MCSAIVTKVTGQTVFDFLRPRLFEPLGFGDVTWSASSEGYSLGGYGLSARTEDIAKFGLLYLQKGRWNGKQILPEAWVETATAKHVENDQAPSGRSPEWRQGYGFQFWRCRHNAYRGDGRDGQICLVMPDQDAVVVMTAQTGQMQLELDLVWEKLLPAFRPNPLPENSAELETLRRVLTNLEAHPLKKTDAK
jgi:CubicO group peptidase (beta-lactamase class C family)